MAGLKENDDWSLLFVEPAVVNAVTNLLEGYDVCREHRDPTEFLKAVFEAADTDETPRRTKLWSRLFARQSRQSQFRRSRRSSSRINQQSTQTFDSKAKTTSVCQSQKLVPPILASDKFTCTYPQLCEMNISPLEGESEQPTDISYYPEKVMECICTPEEESSSSGIHSSDIDSSNSSEESEMFNRREGTFTIETFIRSNVPLDKDTAIKVKNGKASEPSIKRNENETRESLKTPAQTDDRKSRPTLDIIIPSVRNKQEHITESDIPNNEMVTNLEPTNQSKNYDNGGHRLWSQRTSNLEAQMNPHTNPKNQHTFRQMENKEIANIDSIAFPDEMECQVEMRPEVCSKLLDGPSELSSNLVPVIQRKPNVFCLRLDDDYKQAAIKMFLYVLDCEEFITTSIRGFIKSSRPTIKVNFPFFEVISYLLIFNLNSSNFNGTKSNLTDAYPVKCLQYLNFLLSDEYQKYYDKLLSLYDHNFVKQYAYDRIRGDLLKKMQLELQKIVEKPKPLIIQKVETTTVPRFSKLSFREHLSKSRKTEVSPEPEPPPVVIRATRVPQTTYNPPQHKFYKDPKEYREEKLQKARKKSRSPGREEQKDIKRKDSSEPLVCEGCFAVMTPGGQAFSYSRAKSKLHTGVHFRKDDITNQEQQQQQRQQIPTKSYSFDTKTATEGSNLIWKYSKPLPNFSKIAIPVKSTASSVLREGACLRNNEQRTVQKLEWIASGGADFSAVEALLARRRAEEQQEELEAIERKHLQGLLSYEDALVARQNLLCTQRQRALEVKRQREELERQLDIFRREEEEKIRILVEKTHNIQAAAREKTREVQKLKSDVVQKMVREAREQMAEMQMKRREELMERINLIRELRALQGLTKLKQKEIDLTESAGLGLMCEMSIAELNERLNLLREELREEVERKRIKAQFFRAQMKQHVQETQEYINQQRQNRVPDVHSNTDQLKTTRKVESEELKQLRERLNETRKLRLGAK